MEVNLEAEQKQVACTRGLICFYAALIQQAPRNGLLGDWAGILSSVAFHSTRHLFLRFLSFSVSFLLLCLIYRRLTMFFVTHAIMLASTLHFFFSSKDLRRFLFSSWIGGCFCALFLLCSFWESAFPRCLSRVSCRVRRLFLFPLSMIPLCFS